ncbi:MAG: endonuclease domain-containing protein, partial [Acidimicrobiales bacterium]
GIDSIVTVEAVRGRHPDAALFVVSRAGDRFEAIERPAKLTGLPVRRAGREVDPAVLRSAELGFLNGHVPVTGILSAIAVLAAVLDGHDAVVMSNEWSASAGNLDVGGREVNHQWSKGLAFELAFAHILHATFGPTPRYFSLLRPYSELWVARRFAALDRYHRDFMSCNRAFHLDPASRQDRWCGTCDKCCFIDLVLAAFMPAATLAEVFGGREPLADPALLGRFRTLVGVGGSPKPFECVGEVGECRAAARLAAARPDRDGNAVLRALVDGLGPAPAGGSPDHPLPDDLLRPLGEHRVPDGFAPDDLLV